MIIESRICAYSQHIMHRERLAHAHSNNYTTHCFLMATSSFCDADPAWSRCCRDMRCFSSACFSACSVFMASSNFCDTVENVIVRNIFSPAWAHTRTQCDFHKRCKIAYLLSPLQSCFLNVKGVLHVFDLQLLLDLLIMQLQRCEENHHLAMGFEHKSEPRHHKQLTADLVVSPLIS